MKECIEYLRSLQNSYKTVNSNDYEEILTYRKIQFGLSNDDISAFLEKYKSINMLEFYESFLREDIIEPFLGALPVEISSKFNDIYVGILPTFKVNASVIKCPNGKPLVVLHEQLLTLLQHYNESQFLAGNLLNSQNKSDQILGEQLLSDVCKDMVKCFKYHHYLPKLTKLPSTLSPTHYKMSLMKTIIHELFIILHEFSHIYLDHPYEIKHNIFSFSSISNSVEEYVRRQQFELEADLQAIKWLIEVSKSKKLSSNPLFHYVNTAPCMALEVFMLFHIFDISTNRQPQNIIPNFGEDENNINAIILNMVKEADNLISNNETSDTYSHPKASTRLINAAAYTFEYFDKPDQDFLLGMLRDMAFYKTFEFNPLE